MSAPRGGRAIAVIEGLSTVSGYLAGAIVLVMALLETVAVLSRRLLQVPLHFSDEYSAYLMVGAVYLGAGYTLLKDAHVRVDLVAIRLPERWRTLLRAGTSGLALLFCVVLTWQSVRLVVFYREIGHTSLSVLETPTWIPACIIPVGAAVLTLQMLVAIVTDLRLLAGRR